MSFPDLVTTTAGFNVEGDQVGVSNPVVDGSNFYMIIQSGTPGGSGSHGNLHAYKSTDNGATWIEKDSAHAPANADDTNPPNWFQYYAAVRHPNPATRKIYAVYFNTTNKLEVSAFNMSTDLWETAIPSTLGYLATTSNNFSFGLVATIRGVDNTLFVAAALNNITIGASSADRAYFAKLDLTGLVWDGALTPFGQTNATDTNNWYPVGMVVSPGDNFVHTIFSALGAPGKSISEHQVIKPDNTLGALDIVYQENLASPHGNIIDTGRVFVYTNVVDELIYSMNRFDPTSNSNTQLVVFRGQSAINPTWSTQIIWTHSTAPALKTMAGACFIQDSGTNLYLISGDALQPPSTGEFYWSVCTSVGGTFGPINVIFTGPKNNFKAAPSQMTYLSACFTPGFAMMFSWFVGGVTFNHAFWTAPFSSFNPVGPFGQGTPLDIRFVRSVILPDPKTTWACRYSKPPICICRNKEQQILLHKEFLAI